MPLTSQSLALNPLKDMAQVDEIDYSADFDNLYSRMDDFNKFFQMVKVSYKMLKYIPGLAKPGYQGQLHSRRQEESMRMTLTKMKK